MSKGSTRRPRAVTPAAEASAWDRTFGDPRERMRQDNLAEAERVILQAPPAPWMTPCHDPPTPEP